MHHLRHAVRSGAATGGEGAQRHLPQLQAGRCVAIRIAAAAIIVTKDGHVLVEGLVGGGDVIIQVIVKNGCEDSTRSDDVRQAEGCIGTGHGHCAIRSGIVCCFSIILLDQAVIVVCSIVNNENEEIQEDAIEFEIMPQESHDGRAT